MCSDDVKDNDEVENMMTDDAINENEEVEDRNKDHSHDQGTYKAIITPLH